MKHCSGLLCSLLAYNIIVHLSTPKRYTLYYNHKDDSSVYTACRLSPLSQHELTSASCQWKRYYNSQKIVLFDYLLYIVSHSPSWIKLRTFDVSLLTSRLLPAKDIVRRQMSTGVYVTASSYSHARWEVPWVIRVFVVVFLHVTSFER